MEARVAAMIGPTEQEFNTFLFEKKLTALKDSQDSINSCCHWCLDNRLHHKKIVTSWLNVLKRVKMEHRLTLFYLANDVIQYSKRRNYNFVESWGTTLQKATTMVRDEKVKHKILRIFKIWEQRGIYGEEFISDLCGLISVSPAIRKVDEPHEFQSAYLIQKIRTCSNLENDTDLKLKKLKEHNPKIQIDGESLVASLKDRAHVDDVEKEMDDYSKHMETYLNALKSEIKARVHLISLLLQADSQLDHDRRDVKVVINAYKVFYNKVNTLQQKLEERIPTLNSPIPSPDVNAPSPSPDSDAEELAPNENSTKSEDTSFSPARAAYANAGYYNPVPPPVTEDSQNFTGSSFTSFMGGGMPFDLQSINPSSIFGHSQQGQNTTAGTSGQTLTTDIYSLNNTLSSLFPSLSQPPPPPTSVDSASRETKDYQYGNSANLPLIPPPMPPFSKANDSYSSSYNNSYNNTSSYANTTYDSATSNYRTDSTDNLYQPPPTKYQSPPVTSYQPPANNNYKPPPVSSYQSPPITTYQPPTTFPLLGAQYQPPSGANFTPAATNFPLPNTNFQTPITDYQQNSSIPAYETPVTTNFPIPPVNSYPALDEYNPEEELETWEPEPSWDQLPPIELDTPESPPMFEKEGYGDPIVEYHDSQTLGNLSDVDHRVLPDLPTESLAADTALEMGHRGKDVDHRNLISLTGSPADSSSNQSTWTGQSDQDYRKSQKSIPGGADQDYRVPLNIEHLKLPPPPPPPPKLPTMCLPPVRSVVTPNRQSLSPRKAHDDVESIDMELSDDDNVFGEKHNFEKFRDNLTVITPQEEIPAEQSGFLEPPPPFPMLPDDVDANAFLDELDDDISNDEFDEQMENPFLKPDPDFFVPEHEFFEPERPVFFEKGSLLGPGPPQRRMMPPQNFQNPMNMINSGLPNLLPPPNMIMPQMSGGINQMEDQWTGQRFNQEFFRGRGNNNRGSFNHRGQGDWGVNNEFRGRGRCGNRGHHGGNNFNNFRGGRGGNRGGNRGRGRGSFRGNFRGGF